MASKNLPVGIEFVLPTQYPKVNSSHHVRTTMSVRREIMVYIRKICY